MRRSAPLALLAATTVLTLSFATPALAGGQPFETTLAGANEVGTAGDPDGSGSAQLTINRGTGEICYRITVSDVAPLAAGHIHEADADASGPVVVPLFAGVTSGTAREGCVTVDRSLAKEIAKDPSGYYVNVHNAEFSAGALRGQL